MDTQQKSEDQYTSPAFAICGVCDAEYPIGTAECTKCKSPLSAVRKCFECGRILSAKHERCLYCKASFIQEPGATATVVTRPTAAASTRDAVHRRKAILVSVAVFLLVMFLGLYGTISKLGKTGPDVAATSYILSGASLKLQPSSTAGSSKHLPPSTVVSLTGMAVDPEGHRWYVLREDNTDAFLAVTDVAPPKARLPELGSQMLRAWLLVFRDPTLIPDADSAVHYFCANFAASPHCDELRWLAAERFRSMAERGDAPDAESRARDLYQAIVNGKGPKASDALKALEQLGNTRSERAASSSKRRRSSTEKDSTFGSSHEYALIDRAEVHVRIPELTTLKSGAQVRTPIAKEIRVNGKIAVPSNATCVLNILKSGNKEVEVQLTAIEFGSRRYQVVTEPKSIPIGGTTVVFPLESSLLIGK